MRLVAALMPWAVVREIPESPHGLYPRWWAPAAAAGDVVVAAGDATAWFDCGRVSDYLEANLWQSHGASVVGEGAMVRGRDRAVGDLARRGGQERGVAAPGDPHHVGSDRVGSLGLSSLRLGSIGVPDSGMADFLTSHADLQPKTLAVVDDRPDGTIIRWTYAELETAGQPARARARRPRRRAGARRSCGAARTRPASSSWSTPPARSAQRRCRSTTGCRDEEAAYVTDHCDATVVYVDAEFAADVRAHPRRAPQGAPHPRVRRPGARRDDRASTPAIEPAPDRAAEPGRRTGEAGATMIYTSGTTGKPKGALRRGAGDPTQVHGAARRSSATRPTTSTSRPGPLYHSGPGGFMGIAHAARPDGRAAAQVRPGRLAAPRREVQGDVDVLGADADPDDLQPARRGEGALRPLDRCGVMIANAAPWSFALKQMYVADFPADSLFEVYGSTELGVNTHPRARGPAAQARLVRQGRRRASRSRCSTTTATWSRAPGRTQPGELFVRSRPRCSPTTTSSTTSSRRTSATATRPSATSRTATTRASSTSATARRT